MLHVCWYYQIFDILVVNCIMRKMQCCSWCLKIYDWVKLKDLQLCGTDFG